MKLREKLKRLQDAQAEYHKKANSLSPAEILAERGKFKAIRAEINEVLVEGAVECPDCSHAPLGVFHDGTSQPFEIGCVHCQDHRARATLPEDAVALWNEQKYLPPREPGSLIVRKHDVTGRVLEEKTLRPRR